VFGAGFDHFGTREHWWWEGKVVGHRSHTIQIGMFGAVDGRICQPKADTKMKICQCEVFSIRNIHTRTNDMSRLSDRGGLSSWAWITSPPLSWYTGPYWTNWQSFRMSRQIVWAVVSKRVASDTVSFIHRECRIDSDHFGGVRTYSGSKN
jgi:hypothetical protein